MLSPEMVEIGQCLSVCSAFVEGEYLSASPEDIASVLAKRWVGCFNETELSQQLKPLMEAATERGLLEKSFIPNKYSTTDTGWTLGTDYIRDVLGCIPQQVPA